MTRARHTGKPLLMTVMIIGCLALVILGPQWRDEIRAQVSGDEETWGDCAMFCREQAEVQCPRLNCLDGKNLRCVVATNKAGQIVRCEAHCECVDVLAIEP